LYVGGAYSIVGLDERVVDSDDLDIVVLDAASIVSSLLPL
jgi:hypothetical protein